MGGPGILISDGKQRFSANSEGQSIAATKTRTYISRCPSTSGVP
jgi:hypothetical protein